MTVIAEKKRSRTVCMQNKNSVGLGLDLSRLPRLLALQKNFNYHLSVCFSGLFSERPVYTHQLSTLNGWGSVREYSGEALLGETSENTDFEQVRVIPPGWCPLPPGGRYLISLPYESQNWHTRKSYLPPSFLTLLLSPLCHREFHNRTKSNNILGDK